jgi:hypothetical protein
MRLRIALALVLLLAPARGSGSSYLYVWGMETRDPSTAMPPASSMGRDFLAVFDVRPASRRFGKLIAMLPVGAKGQMAHHANYEMPSDGRLFTSDYMSGDGFVFDLREATRPTLVASFANAGPYTHAHSFVRLPNGHTLATYQFRGEPDVEPGALVELDEAGRVVRTSDASDASVETFIRPYSLVALPGIDRVVTTSAAMLPTGNSTHVVQLWRLSDLKLLKTIALSRPARFADAVAKSATEPRLLNDGKTVLVVTSACGLYRLSGLERDQPQTQLVYDFGYRSCGVPAVVGRYWIQTSFTGHALISLDVSDPSHPVEVGRLSLKPDELPHWVAREPRGNRIVITGFGALATRALFATVNPRTGALSLDRREIDFDRAWPDGWTGPAMPHAALFGN